MTAATFTEDWFCQASCDVLAGLVRSVENVPGRIVEIGSWEGRSTIAIANATSRPVHAVDTWQGSPGEPSADLAARRDVFATWSNNIAAETHGNVYPHRMGWREYAQRDTSPIALLFIDAEHSYREVFDAIAAFLPMMSPGGVICGDDTHHGPVQRAVMEWFPDADVSATLWIRRVDVNLETEYWRLCATPSDINEHLPTLVEAVHQLNAHHVIELGTRGGVSTVAFLYALTKTGGRLTSVDIDPPPPGLEHDQWTFIQGDDLAPGTVEQLADADIVFIDTSHHYEHTRRELNLYKWLVRPGGLLILHDTELAHPMDSPPGDPSYPVKRAVLEFVESEGREWWNDARWPGLGIIRM